MYNAEKHVFEQPSWYGLKNGTDCWAWQYDWPSGLSLPMSSMKPARGILAESNMAIGDVSKGPGWFVPYRRNTKTPAWTKAVRVEAVNIASDKDTAVTMYNKAVSDVMARFQGILDIVQKDLV